MRFSLRRFIAARQLAGALFFVTSMVSAAHGQLAARIPSTAPASVLTLCKTSNVKVVFICKDTLRFVDFSESAPQIRTMNNVASAYFPVISSDGKWVTYQTGIEAEGPSTSSKVGTVWLRELAATGAPIKIADTGYVPRFVQNTPADAPEIIYSTSVTCPGNICYNKGQTLKKKIVNGTPQPAQVVCATGSYYGGLSYDGCFLNTGWPGGPNAFMLDLQDNAAAIHPVHTMRVKKNGTNADTAVTIGTCNISRSASAIFTNTMLFYDFSSVAISSAGCYHPLLGTWGMHAKLFISRYDAEDLKVFDMPADRPLTPVANAQGVGEAVGKEWYNPEWSNHPYYAASSLLVDRIYSVNGSWDHTYNCESVYLADLKDSSYAKLIESTDSSYASKTDLTYPFLWVERSSGFMEDSTWLRYTIWERAGQGVRYFNNNGKSLNSRSGFFNGKDITEIVLYSLRGQKIESIRGTWKSMAGVENVFKNVHSGSYFIGLKTKDAQKAFYRWIVEK